MTNYLNEPPDGQPPPPPVDTAEQVLPFRLLTWKNFERLVYRLVRLEGEIERSQLFGSEGQNQSGIDVFARKPGGTYATYQCRRVAKMSASDIAEVVKSFMEGEWAVTSSSFTLCTSRSTVRSELAREIETQAKKLRRREPPVAFDVWDAEELSTRLKGHPELVAEYFGQAWLERFLPQAASTVVTEQLATLTESVSKLREERSRVRVVMLDWAPERLRRAMTALSTDDPERFECLTQRVGTPPRRDALAEVVSAPPEWARSAGGDLWELLARLAESLGDWTLSANAWEAAAAKQVLDEAVRSLMSAAASAAVIPDPARHDELLTRAEALDAEHPRVRLERLDERDAPIDQLVVLEALRERAEHPDDRLLIAARMAINRLLLPSVDGARALLAEIEALGEGSAVARSVGLNIVVQQGRVDIIESRPLDVRALREAHDAALELRARLVRERRWEEAARMLMLAADARALVGEREAAAAALRQATPEELAAPTSAVVLADSAASRALDLRLALELLRDAPAEDRVVRRIRAGALEEVGTPDERRAAHAELDALIADGGEEAAEAAFIRLAATLGDHHVAWSDDAAAFLMQNGYERAAVTARALYLARWEAAHEDAEALLDPYRAHAWAKVLRLRLALSRTGRTPLKEAADEVMGIAPTQGHRVDAGRAYAMAGDFGRSKQVLIDVARDRFAPQLARRDAYRLLMRVVGSELEDWELAATLHAEWAALCPGDGSVNVWAPTVASRRRRALQPPTGCLGRRHPQ